MSAPTTGSYAWQLVEGTPALSDIAVLTHTGTLQSYQESLLGISQFLQSQGQMISGSYTLLNGKYQPTGSYQPAGSYITGSYTLLDGRYQATGTISVAGFITGSYTLLDGKYQSDACEGRLTLASGTAVPTTDQTAQTRIWLAPYIGNRISLYNGAAWDVLTFSHPSVAVPSVATGTFDIFAYNNAGTVALETTNWTNDTTRATALVRQDGVLVKSGDATRRYLGTGRTTTSSGQCEDSAGGTNQNGGKRFLWNYYNRVKRPSSVIDTTDTWNYTTDTWRYANGGSGNKIEFVIGVAEDAISAYIFVSAALANNSARGSYVAVGLDSSSSPSGIRQGGFNGSGAFTLISPLSATYEFIPSIGYHFIAWLEKGADGTSTWQGDQGGAGFQSGMSASIFS